LIQLIKNALVMCITLMTELTMRHVSPAIIHGLFIFHYLRCISSETCNGLSDTHCLTCKSLNNRTFDSTNNKCPCDLYYFDDGTNNATCKPCHYSWFFDLFFIIFLLVFLVKHATDYLIAIV